MVNEGQGRASRGLPLGLLGHAARTEEPHRSPHYLEIAFFLVVSAAIRYLAARVVGAESKHKRPSQIVANLRRAITKAAIPGDAEQPGKWGVSGRSFRKVEL